jgi:hypothetical protein
MEFYENYRKKYNDLLIAVENFDLSLSDEFYAVKTLHADRIMKYQIRKYELTFEMFTEQIRLYLQMKHLKTSRSLANLMRTFHSTTELPDSIYEVLLHMTNWYKKMNTALEELNPSFNKNLHNMLETFYSVMLLCITYLDYDDNECFTKINLAKDSDKKISFPEF